VCVANPILAATRKIPKVPFKVLDAPALQDDFYLNLVDWSAQNVLAVGLGSCVYLWSACTSKVTKLCDLSSGGDCVTSVSWTQRGTHLAVGTNLGETQVWDTVKCKKIRSMRGHSARVGTMSWQGHTLASGSRDRLIFLRDVRAKEPFTTKLQVRRVEWKLERGAPVPKTSSSRLGKRYERLKTRYEWLKTCYELLMPPAVQNARFKICPAPPRPPSLPLPSRLAGRSRSGLNYRLKRPAL